MGIELNEDLKPLLTDKPYEVLLGQDFLTYTEETWDRIVMNPPFSKCQDRTHILKAYELLNSGGILVAVASSSILALGAVNAAFAFLFPLRRFQIAFKLLAEKG